MFLNTVSYIFTNIQEGVIGAASSIVPAFMVSLPISNSGQFSFGLIVFSIATGTIGGVLADTYTNSIYNGIICGVLTPIVITIINIVTT